MNERASILTRRVQSFAMAHTALNSRETHLAVHEAELDVAFNFSELSMQEKTKQIRAEIEAELDARFKTVEPLEGMMAEVARRESALAEREKQCSYLLEEVSEKTAELVLAKEGLFAKRADGTLKAMINEFASLRHAIDEKAIVPIPSGKFDDAKNGEGTKNGKEEEKEKEESGQAAEGKAVVVYQDKSHKLLASSTSAATTHRTRASTAIPHIEFDVALATTLEMMQSFEMMKEGVTEIPNIQPI